MPENKGESLRDILRRVLPLFSKDLDFTRTDPEGVAEIVKRLVAAAFTFNVLGIAELGGRFGPERESGLVEQTVAAAFQTFGGVDPHPHPFEKAAMLVRGITAGHPFSDGNKRSGFLLAMYYLELVGLATPDDLPEDEVVGFCVKVSAGEVRDVGKIAGFLARLWHQLNP